MKEPVNWNDPVTRCAKSPHLPAYESGGWGLSYGQLLTRARVLAAALEQLWPGEGPVLLYGHKQPALPAGMLACLLGKLSPWRVRRTATCVQCGACLRACRYGALDRLREGREPGPSCVLCRDCLSACAHNGLCLRWAGKGGNGLAERAFVVIVSALHAVFLFTAMA